MAGDGREGLEAAAAKCVNAGNVSSQSTVPGGVDHKAPTSKKATSFNDPVFHFLETDSRLSKRYFDIREIEGLENSCRMHRS